MVFFTLGEQLLLWQVLDSIPLIQENNSLQTFSFASLETIIMVSNGVSIQAVSRHRKKVLQKNVD